MKKLMIATILATLSFSAAADQCHLLDKADAEIGVEVLSRSTTAYKLLNLVERQHQRKSKSLILKWSTPTTTVGSKFK
jgi:hypothetical protein